MEALNARRFWCWGRGFALAKVGGFAHVVWVKEAKMATLGSTRTYRFRRGLRPPDYGHAAWVSARWVRREVGEAAPRRHGDLDGLEEARRGILAQREGKGLAGWTALGDTPLSTTQGDVH